jgi:hypothetical protein
MDQSSTDPTKWQNPICPIGNYSITLDLPWLAVTGDGTAASQLGWKTDLTSTNPTTSVVWVGYDYMHIDGVHHQTIQVQSGPFPAIMSSSAVLKLEPSQTVVLHLLLPADWNNNLINGTVGGSVVVTFYSTDPNALIKMAIKPTAREDFVCYFPDALTGVPTPHWLSESVAVLRQSETTNQWVSPAKVSPASSRYGPSGQIMDFAVKNTTVNGETISVWTSDATGATPPACSTTISLSPGAAIGTEVSSLLPETCFPEPNGLVPGLLHIKPVQDGNADTFQVWGLQLFGPAATGVQPF